MVEKWILTKDEFRHALIAIATSDTSADPGGWTPENPLWGHCAVCALLAQELFGGELLRASLDGTEFALLRSHYWNLFMAGECDFTESQFRGRRPHLSGSLIPPPGYLNLRLYAFSHYETRIRYARLSRRMSEWLKKMVCSRR